MERSAKQLFFCTISRICRTRGSAARLIYPLDEVLLLCLLAVLGGAETIVDIARFDEKKIGLLRRFRPFHDGTPAHDHLGDILATLDAAQFQSCFVTWVAALTGAPADSSPSMAKRYAVPIRGRERKRARAARDFRMAEHPSWLCARLYPRGTDRLARLTSTAASWRCLRLGASP